MTEDATPEGMIPVSWEEFYACIGPRDIVLRCERTFVDWETRGRILIGRSFPGWFNTERPKVYFLERSAAREIIGALGRPTAPAVRRAESPEPQQP